MLLVTKKLSLNEVLYLISKVCACAKGCVGVTVYCHDVDRDMCVCVCVCVFENWSAEFTHRHTHTEAGLS